MNKNIATCIFAAGTFLISFAGIYRHDVMKEKYINLAKEKSFDCVGQIFEDSTLTGSCVLISDRYVLSAAHIFFKTETVQETIQNDATTKIVSNNPVKTCLNYKSTFSLHFNGQKIKAKKIIFHPHYFAPTINEHCDIVLIELEHSIPNLTPAYLNFKSDEQNSKVVGVGFGVSGRASNPEEVDFHQEKIAGENIIDSIGGKEYLGKSTLLFCDFDHPTRKDCNKMGSSVPRPLEYIPGGGDSGGGLFRLNGKKWELIGICSGKETGTEIQQLIKSGYYGQTMSWTRVSPFINWIQEQTKLSF